MIERRYDDLLKLFAAIEHAEALSLHWRAYCDVDQDGRFVLVIEGEPLSNDRIKELATIAAFR